MCKLQIETKKEGNKSITSITCQNIDVCPEGSSCLLLAIPVNGKEYHIECKCHRIDEDGFPEDSPKGAIKVSGAVHLIGAQKYDPKQGPKECALVYKLYEDEGELVVRCEGKCKRGDCGIANIGGGTQGQFLILKCKCTTGVHH